MCEPWLDGDMSNSANTAPTFVAGHILGSLACIGSSFEQTCTCGWVSDLHPSPVGATQAGDRHVADIIAKAATK